MSAVLNAVNLIVRDLIQSRVPLVSGPTQVGFEPPDEHWRTAVMGGGEDRLNIYLYEIREDLKYRNNERTSTFQEGWIHQNRTPERLDCHYLITAWSPMVYSPPVSEPTLDEHNLLYEVITVLFRHRALIPAEVYRPGITIPSGRSLVSVPADIRDDSLPLDAALADQIRDLGDYWSTMRVIWRPTIGLTITIPVIPGAPPIISPPVTTIAAEYLQQQEPGSMETMLTIGGRVLQGASETPVANAWVQIQGTSAEVNQVYRRMLSRADGSFIFGGLWAGQYQLTAIAQGLGNLGRSIEAPSPTGEYDLRFP
jgi:hypothetical protein